MTAVLVPAFSEAEWLAERRKGITASEIAVVMGLSPYSSPFALYHQKTGDLPGPDDNLAMALGRHLESFVAQQFEDVHPEFALTGTGQNLYAHPRRPWQLATPDRLLLETDLMHMPGAAGPMVLGLSPVAVLECKTSASYDGWGDDGTDEIPVHYRCQVLWQMDVMGVTTGYVACLFLHSRQLRVYELTMDDRAEADLTLMRCEAQIFRQRILNNRPPEVDWRPATSAALKRLHPGLEDRDVTITRTLASQYRRACHAVKTAERRKHLFENRIREQLGNGRRALDRLDGSVIATRQVYDVKEHVRKAAHVDKLVIAKPKEATS